MKKWIHRLLLFALILSLTIVSVQAAESPQLSREELSQQISELESQLAPLANQAASYESSETYIIMGKVVQTSPKFIVEGGAGLLNYGALMGVGTPYYIVTNPEDGAYISGTYTGRHLTGDIVSIWINGIEQPATILSPLPAERLELYNQVDALEKQIDALKEQRSNLAKQSQERRTAYIELLKKYATDENGSIVFQLENPYMVAYGAERMIEEGNQDACPVVIDGSTMIPIRPLMDVTYGETYWGGEQDPTSVGVSIGCKNIRFTLNDPVALVDNVPTTMPVPAQVVNGKTMIPLRFVAEQFGMKVEWVQEDQVIRIGYSYNWSDHLELYTRNTDDGRKEVIDPDLKIRYKIPKDGTVKSVPASRDFFGRLTPYQAVVTVPQLGTIQMELTDYCPTASGEFNAQYAENDGSEDLEFFGASDTKNVPLSEHEVYVGIQSIIRQDYNYNELHYFIKWFAFPERDYLRITLKPMENEDNAGKSVEEIASEIQHSMEEKIYQKYGVDIDDDMMFNEDSNLSDEEFWALQQEIDSIPKIYTIVSNVEKEQRAAIVECRAALEKILIELLDSMGMVADG